MRQILGSSRRRPVVAFGIASVALVLSSTAYACTIWRGQMTVNKTGSTATVKGWGEGSIGMQHCPGRPWDGAVSVDADTDSVDVVVAPVGNDGNALTNCYRSGDNHLNQSGSSVTYDINFINTGFADFVGIGAARDWNHDCMTNGSSGWFKIGTITINSAGSGSASNVAIDKSNNHPNGQAGIADLPGTESAICVSAPNASEGMQNPITVI